MGSRRWYGWPPHCREIKRLTREKERRSRRQLEKRLADRVNEVDLESEGMRSQARHRIEKTVREFLDKRRNGGTLEEDDTVRTTMKHNDLDDYEREDSVDLDAFLLHPEELEPGWYDPPDPDEGDNDDDFWDRFDDALAAYDDDWYDFVGSDPDDYDDS
jgi:hypothetical protein